MSFVHFSKMKKYHWYLFPNTVFSGGWSMLLLLLVNAKVCGNDSTQAVEAPTLNVLY
jgi:hypothetical protein